MAANWFYADAHNQQQGPVDGAWLANAYRAGTVKAETLVWREGLGNWVPLRQVAAQMGLIIVGAAPPLPSRSADGGGRIVKPSGSSNTWVIVVVLIFGFVAVLAIFAAISIPAYQDYTTRSKVTEGIVLADGVKVAVVEYYESTQRCPHNSDEGFSKPQEYAGRYVSGIDVGVDKASGACAVQVTYKDIPGIEGKELRFLLQSDGSWHISTNLPPRYLTQSIRDKMR